MKQTKKHHRIKKEEGQKTVGTIITCKETPTP